MMALSIKRLPPLPGPSLLLLRSSRPSSLLRNSRKTIIPSPRRFTQAHPLLLLTRTSSPRPQLPYLSQPSSRPSAFSPATPPLQRQIARLLSTETRSYVKEQVWLATKWTAVGWTMLLMLAWAYYGWQQELIEREHPSPEEWTYLTRTAFRHGHAKVSPEFDGSGIIDWGGVASEFRRCLERLESADKDGKDLTPVAQQLPSSPSPSLSSTWPQDLVGLDPTAYDISSKSHAWKTGYFQTVMSCARAAEFLDDMVRDKKRKLVFPKSVVLGPSNPDPRPVPPGAQPAPHESDCDRPFAPPEAFYNKVLAGRGFSSAQRLEAALGLANWLEFNGQSDEAALAYHSAIDTAAAALPYPADAIIDTVTGIVKVQKQPIIDDAASSAAATGLALPSRNLLQAATALATHHARTGNPDAALPIFLSVLRARRSAPQDTSAPLYAVEKKFDRHAGTDYGAFFSLLRGVIRKAEFPPAPAFTGDEPFLRPQAVGDDDGECAEAELMVYIGEILFASGARGDGAGQHAEEGLDWTRRAVQIAERAVSRESDRQASRVDKTCKPCLETGVRNWGLMVRKLLREEQAGRLSSSASTSSWTAWLGLAGAKKDHGESRWEKEVEEVGALQERLVEQGISQRLAASAGVGAVPGTVWMG